MTPPPSAPSSRGRWIVVALLVAGVIGAMTSVLYWRAQQEQESAGPAPTPAQSQGQRELEDLETRANKAVADQNVAPLIPEAKRLVAAYPTLAGGHRLLGQLLIDQPGQTQQALDEIELSLKYDPQEPEVEKLAGSLALSLAQSDKAIHHFDQASGLDSHNAKYRLYLAQAYKQKKDFDKAQFTLLQALKMDSHLHEAYFALSDLAALQGNTAQAIVQVQRAIAEVPEKDAKDRVAYTRNLAILLRRDNRPAEAIQALEALDPADRRSLEVIGDLAVCWEMLGQPIKGAKLFEEGMGTNPTEWRFPAGAALWYLRVPDKPAARRMINLAAHLDADPAILEKLNAELAKPPPTTRP